MPISLRLVLVFSTSNRRPVWAHNALLDLEELDEAEIEHIRRDYRKLAAEARKAIQKGKRDTDSLDVDHRDDLKHKR